MCRVLSKAADPQVFRAVKGTPTVRLMRKALVAVAVAVTALTTGCQAAAVDDTVPSNYAMEQADRADMPAEVRDILDSGRLTIGTKFDQPLTGLRDDATGRIEGFDAEIGRIIAQRIFGSVAEGENLDFIETVPGNREKYLADGTVDLVIATYTMTPAREKEVTFAGPYYQAGQAIMTRKGEGIEDVKDLAGKKVCTAEGSTSQDNVAKQSPKAKVDKQLRDWSGCRKALLAEQFDAVSTDDLILYGFASQDPTELEVSEKTFTTEPYGIGMRKGAPGLQKFINETLELAFAKDGDWKTAFDLTLGDAGVPNPGSPPKLDTN